MRRTLQRSLFGIAAVLALSVGGAAQAKKDKPEVRKEVTIRVLDSESNQPISNAWVRIPGTEGGRMVDKRGEWAADMLYRLDGEEFGFVKGRMLEFTITAPGYESNAFRYKVRGMGNMVTIDLVKEQSLDVGGDDLRDEVIDWFNRTRFEPTDDSLLEQEEESTASTGGGEGG